MTTTPSPEGLQEPALREALRKSVEGWNNLVEFGIIPPQHRTAARILAEEGDAALKAAPPVPHDNGLRDALEPFANAARNCEMPVAQSAAKWLCWEDFARADRVLTTLPQQAATDESRYRDALERINQAVIDGQVCDDVAWFDKFTTLHDFIEETLRPSAPAAVADLFPTPTSQPPAAETRLRDAAARIMQEWRWGNLTKLGVANHLRRAGFRIEVAQAKANELAALTQPEPTAQQATKDWCLKMAELEGNAEIGAGMPDHPLRAAQQAAGEAEAVAMSPQDYWRAVAKSAGEHGVRYRTNRALERFLADEKALHTPASAAKVIDRAVGEGRNA